MVCVHCGFVAAIQTYLDFTDRLKEAAKAAPPRPEYNAGGASAAYFVLFPLGVLLGVSILVLAGELIFHGGSSTTKWAVAVAVEGALLALVVFLWQRVNRSQRRRKADWSRQVAEWDAKWRVS